MMKYIEKQELYDWIKSIKKDISKEDKHFLNDMRIAPFYKCKMLVITEEDEIASILCYTVTKGYLNVYYQYTVPSMRRKGYTGALLDEVMQTEDNIDRVFVRASTPEIQAFYDKRQFKNFGLDKNGAQLRESWYHITDNRPAKSLKYIVNE